MARSEQFGPEITRPNEIARIAVGDILRRARNRCPERTAFVVPQKDESVTFRQFDERANRAAHAFRDAGLEEGDRLALISANSLQFMTALFGAAKAGLVFVPLSTEMTTEGISYELDHSGADALIVDDTFYPDVEPVLDDASDVDALAFIDWEGEDVPLPSFRSLIEGSPIDEPDVEIDDRDLAMIMYTSGTTSKPKGVMISHKSIFTGVNNWCCGYRLGNSDVASCFMPLFHNGQLSLTLAAVHASAASVIQREYDPEVIVDDIENHDVTISIGIPFMYKELAEIAESEDRDVSSLSQGVYGMPMSTDTRKRLIDVFDAEFPLIYGMTEAFSPVTCWTDAEEQMEKSGNYIGRAAANNDVAVMDDDGNLLPQGEVGELVHRGPNVMEGYLKDREKTQEAFRHGWLHSGDMGYYDEDGCIKFVDRKKHIIKTGGENVSTQKVEDVLRDHPGVDEVSVVGLPHDRWGEAVTAFVIPEADAEYAQEAILDYSKEHLSGFETPKDVIFVDEMPKSVSGKAQKHHISEEFQDHYSGG